MVSLTIRCRPCVPVPIAELETWLTRRLEELRAELPPLRVRLLRLTQPLPSDDIEVGWLLEFELPGDEYGPIERRLLARVTDMRLLGLQPTLLHPGEPAARSAEAGLATSSAGNGQREPAARSAQRAGERHVAWRRVSGAHDGGAAPESCEPTTPTGLSSRPWSASSLRG
jgi:hypothetical protein